MRGPLIILVGITHCDCGRFCFLLFY